MDLFRYFFARDEILEAGKFLGNAINTEETVIEEDDEMETEPILHDDTSIDKLSKVEKFYLKQVMVNGKVEKFYLTLFSGLNETLRYF